MSLLNLNVSLAPLNTDQLRGFWLDSPTPGNQTKVYTDNESTLPGKTTRWISLDIVGWVVGRSSPTVAVELLHEGVVFHRAPFNVHRSDIVTAFPRAPRGKNSGFHTNVVLPETASDLEIRLQVVLENDTRVLLGVVRVWRLSLRNNLQPHLQPIMLTTLGRTGSTWVMKLLGQHPQIVAYRPFQYEPRVSSYWMQILQILSEPASYLAPVTGLDWTSLDQDGNRWQSGNKTSSEVPKLVDLQIQRWLEHNGVEAVANFCKSRVSAFYAQVAIAQGQTRARYFAEKYLPNHLMSATIQEMYPQSREIVLVRDFRDMVASILAYNAKRGFAAFGREHAASDNEYVHQMRPSALRLLESWKRRSDNAYLLRYEDLILQPVSALGSLLEYLELDASPLTIEGMFQRASQERTGQEQHRTSPDLRKSIGRWRRDLDPSLQDVCQEAFGDVLEEFGYE